MLCAVFSKTNVQQFIKSILPLNGKICRIIKNWRDGYYVWFVCQFHWNVEGDPFGRELSDQLVLSTGFYHSCNPKQAFDQQQSLHPQHRYCINNSHCIHNTATASTTPPMHQQHRHCKAETCWIGFSVFCFVLFCVFVKEPDSTLSFLWPGRRLISCGTWYTLSGTGPGTHCLALVSLPSAASWASLGEEKMLSPPKVTTWTWRSVIHAQPHMLTVDPTC